MVTGKYSIVEKQDIQQVVKSPTEKQEVTKLKELIKSQLSEETQLKKFLDDTYSKQILDDIFQNPGSLAEIQADIQKRKQNFQLAVEAIFKPLSETPNLLNQKEETLKSKIEKFRLLNPVQQSKQIKSLQQEIQDRKQTLVALLKISETSTEFEELNINERKTYLKKRQKIQTQIQNISKKFTKHDTQIISDTKQNTLKENQNLLTELKKRIDTQNRLNQKFPSGVGLTEQYYQKLYPNFLILKEQEKNNILLSIQQDLTLKYLNKIHQSSELAPKDVEIMENTTKTQPFDIKLVCTCLNYFDMNIKIAIECSEYAKSIDPLILGHFNWDRIGSFDRKTLIKSDKIEKYTSQQSHIEYDTLFAKYCQEFFYKHDLRFSTEEQTQIQNQFQNSKLQDKNAILNFLQIKHKQPIKLQLKDKKLQPKFLKTLIQREMLQADFQKLKTNNQKLYQTKFLKQEFAKKCELITKIQKAELKQSQEIQAFAKNNQDVFKNRYLDKILKQLNTNNIEQYLAPLQKHERNLEAIKATIKECMQNQHLSKSQKQIFQKEIQKCNNPADYEKLFLKYNLLNIYQTKQFQSNQKLLQKQIKNKKHLEAIETIQEQIQFCQDPSQLRKLFKLEKNLQQKLQLLQEKENPKQSMAFKLLQEFITENATMQLKFEKIQMYHQILKHRTIQDYFQTDQENTLEIQLDKFESQQELHSINQTLKHIEKTEDIEIQTQALNSNQTNLPSQLLKLEIQSMCQELESFLLKKFQVCEFTKEAKVMQLLKEVLNDQTHSQTIWQSLD